MTSTPCSPSKAAFFIRPRTKDKCRFKHSGGRYWERKATSRWALAPPNSSLVLDNGPSWSLFLMFINIEHYASVIQTDTKLEKSNLPEIFPPETSKSTGRSFPWFWIGLFQRYWNKLLCLISLCPFVCYLGLNNLWGMKPRSFIFGTLFSIPILIINLGHGVAGCVAATAVFAHMEGLPYLSQKAGGRVIAYGCLIKRKEARREHLDYIYRVMSQHPHFTATLVNNR